MRASFVMDLRRGANAGSLIRRAESQIGRRCIRADDNRISGDVVNADERAVFEFDAVGGAREPLQTLLTDAAAYLPDAARRNRHYDLRRAPDELLAAHRTRRLLTQEKLAEQRHDEREYDAARDAEHRTDESVHSRQHADSTEPAERRDEHTDDARIYKTMRAVRCAEVARVQIEAEQLEDFTEHERDEKEAETDGGDDEKNGEGGHISLNFCGKRLMRNGYLKATSDCL